MEAAYAVVFTINRLPTLVFNSKSPFEKLFHCISNYTFLRTFDCECFLLMLSSSTKLQPRFVQCVFLRYASPYKGYSCYDPKTGKIYISHHVHFYENVFPFQKLSSIHMRMPQPSESMVRDILSFTNVSQSALSPSSFRFMSHFTT